jgi:hypothetical protein
MNNQIKEINSTTYPELFAAMDAYVVECGFWAYPDAEWQNNFIDSWIGVNPDHSMQ